MAMPLYLTGILEEVPDHPRNVVLIFGAKVVDIRANQLCHIEAGQQVDSLPERVVELECERIGQIEHITLGEAPISAKAIPTHRHPTRYKPSRKMNVELY
jgi:hypothetical protein